VQGNSVLFFLDMILIVDDNQENIFSLKSLLELHRFEVDSASSGEEALKKILKNNYALIILDVQMPGMDGFEVAEAIAGYSKAKDTPIIFLSAVNTHKKFIAKGYTSGGIDYVTKPFDPDILLLKVQTFCRLYEQTRELNEAHKALWAEMEFKTIAEAGLQQSIEELRSILESIPQIAFTTKPDGKVEFVNNHWFNYSPEKNTFPETAPGTDTIQECLDLAIKLRAPRVCEVRIKKTDAREYHYYLLGMTPVKKAKTITKWVGVFTDIHEQKMASQILENKVAERTGELKKANLELESRNGELQQFAFVASHDLQEPLRKIQVFSAIVRDKFLDGKAEALSYIERVISSSDRMRALISDLLNYSRLSAKDLSVTTDLNFTIDQIRNDLEMIIKAKKAMINVSPLPEIEAIPGQIHQVFQNLISNALKFSKDGEPTLIDISGERIAERSLDACVSPTGNYCRIKVKDNGIGFSQEYSEKIFNIFQRLNSQTKYEGTGIGLAIVKKVIEKHHGLIAAFSKENVGTTFIIVLPLHQELTVAA
jgi:signal transduction histidine kinase/CheY-like chemotaxis protein